MNKLTKEIAIFGGGCFWCTEAIFQMLRGVDLVVSGYAGGKLAKPSYEAVSGGQTGHAEVIKIEFDPAVISYENLLEVFFATHDPTRLNRQGNDVGEQYRSLILTTSDEQNKQAQAYIKKLTDSGEFSASVATKVEPLKEFFSAESYHQNYYQKNTDAPYCQIVISPKVAKFKEKHPELLKS